MDSLVPLSPLLSRSLVAAAFLAPLVACSGGDSFEASATSPTDGGSTPADGGTIVVGVGESPTPTGANGAVAAGSDGGGDAAAGLSTRLDGGPDGSMTCSAPRLACGASCVPDDKANCGACGNACIDPPNGLSACGGEGATRGCTLACSAGYTACGSTCFAIADFANDARNCGACGFDCIGGACVAGVCQSWQVATSGAGGGGGGRANMVTDGTTMTWRNVNGIFQVPVAGGTPSTIVPAFTDPSISWNLALANGGVIYTDGLEIRSTTYPGPVSIQASEGGLHGLAASGTDVYSIFYGETQAQSSYAASMVRGSIAPGGPPPVTVFAVGGVGDLVATADALYWTDPDSGNIGRASLPSLTTTFVATGQVSPNLITADASNVYWANLAPNTSTTPTQASVSRAPVTGGTAQVIFPARNGAITGLALDATNLYITYQDSVLGQTGKLDYVPLDGSAPPKTLQTFTSSAPIGVLAAGGAIYWASGAGIQGLKFP